MRCGSSFIRDLIFLSTPSARRATAANLQQIANVGISIHALREEGDAGVLGKDTCRQYFYPRPPRGGRRQRVLAFIGHADISIHALREEGDLPLSAATSH